MQKYNKRRIIIIVTPSLIVLIAGLVFFWPSINNIFFGGCGQGYYSNRRGWCYSLNLVHVEFHDPISEDEVLEILENIEGAGISRKTSSMKYTIRIQAQDKKEHNSIIQQLHAESEEIKIISPVFKFFNPVPAQE